MRTLLTPIPFFAQPSAMREDQQAAQIWDRIESLEETNARIHDGACGTAALTARAQFYVEKLLFDSFPIAVPLGNADILEIGSGVGWIMQAMNHYLSDHGRRPRRIIGLDIAPNMLAKARQRLGTIPPYDYILYDGIHVPLPDETVDLIYSVAALQHVPRPYVFNLFFEIKRLLRPNGFAVLRLLSTDQLQTQEKLHAWRTEITNQVSGSEAHWHHFYTATELRAVLSVTGFPKVAIADSGTGTLVVCVTSNANAELPHATCNAGISSEEYVQALKNEVANLQNEVANLQVRIAEQISNIEALHASTSWRMTSPIRSIVRAVRGAIR